jgi:hypothetical protein
MVLANQNAKLTGPDQGFLVSPLVLTLKPWERGWKYCYKASAGVDAKCDWLISGHAALDKSNVSRRTRIEKLLPTRSSNMAASSKGKINLVPRVCLFAGYVVA